MGRVHCHRLIRLERLDRESPILQLRFRVNWNRLPEYLELYDHYFLPVDQASGRQVLRLLHETGSHFNLTVLYRYPSWEAWTKFYRTYQETWAKVHGHKDPASAEEEIEQLERRLAEMVEDDEKNILFQLQDGLWS